jgi:protocatechuate 3,4-dioxygenase alpha subunit
MLPFDDDPWELYHVAVDRSECHDLAADEPERLAAMIELWQPEAGFGRLGTNNDGWCRFETVRPDGVAGATEAPHINVCLFARGLLRHLYTRIYFEGDAGLDHDPLLSAVPADRRPTLLARLTAGQTWEFVVRLQGAAETVFFDI